MRLVPVLFTARVPVRGQRGTGYGALQAGAVQGFSLEPPSRAFRAVTFGFTSAGHWAHAFEMISQIRILMLFNAKRRLN